MEQKKIRQTKYNKRRKKLNKTKHLASVKETTTPCLQKRKTLTNS